MTPQAWPLYAAGMSGQRKGKLYAVVGWLPHYENAPELGDLPVLVPLNGGAVAQKYDVDKGIARLFATLDEARGALSDNT